MPDQDGAWTTMMMMMTYYYYYYSMLLSLPGCELTIRIGGKFVPSGRGFGNDGRYKIDVASGEVEERGRGDWIFPLRLLKSTDTAHLWGIIDNIPRYFGAMNKKSGIHLFSLLLNLHYFKNTWVNATTVLIVSQTTLLINSVCPIEYKRIIIYI
jgi:hypothetical protein